MRIISERRVKEFGQKYPEASLSVANWMRAVKAAKWSNQAVVQTQFQSSDFVGEKTVFDIAQNRYRLIAFVSFRCQIVFIKQILSHKEYDKGNWKA